MEVINPFFFELNINSPIKKLTIIENIVNNILNGRPVSLSRSGKKDPTTVKSITSGIIQIETIERENNKKDQPIAVKIPNAMCAL